MGEARGVARRHLSLIYDAAVRAVDPARLVQRHVRRHGGRSSIEAAETSWEGAVTIVGAGKAAARMAAGCEAALGAENVRGMVIVPDGARTPLASIRVAEASHPVPDARALRATELICRLLESRVDEPVISLISGGASSLLVRPRTPLTLEDKQETTRTLLVSGATIQQANAVRKHLSTVKGGGLLRHARSRPVVSLLLSDVVGDDPSVIGSGPTAADPTSFAEALDVFRDLAIEAQVPSAVRSFLERGARGELTETVKPGAAELRQVANILIGTNRTALEGAAEEARRLGYQTFVLEDPLTGDTTEGAHAWVTEVAGVVGSAGGGPACVIAGGETTVVVRGKGQGGRNQEFALATIETLAGSRITVLSAGTDGIDGATSAAGAFVDGQSLERAQKLGLDPRQFLQDNDSHTFFAKLDDLFAPGPTGTNVMDIKVALSLGSAANSPMLQN